MDELFHRLNRPFGALPDLVETLISDLVRRLDLVWAELTVAEQQTLTVRRSGRALTSDWKPGGGHAHPSDRRPHIRSIDDAVHAADRFETLELEAPRPELDSGVLWLPLAFGDRPMGDLRLAWKNEGERRRNAPPWLAAFARHCSFLINRYIVRDWSERRLGHPLLLVGMSRVMRHLEGLLEHAARSDLPVLLSGEFGTEKLPLAAIIHCGGRRRDGPFVQINCAEPLGTPGDWFEQAAGGTLFLNGIDELPSSLQRQLPLHMHSHLDQWSVGRSVNDARIVAATTLDLRERVTDRSFSRGLLAELDILSIAAPPLRERREDIEALIGASLERRGFRAEDKLTEALVAVCRTYSWPENLYELERVVTRLAVMTGGRKILREDILLHCPWIMEDTDLAAVYRPSSAKLERPESESERWVRCAVHRDAAELGRLHEGLARALLYLGDHYAEPISLTQLARHAHVSESHISFLFRTALDMPFKGVLGRIRIHKAKEILASESRLHITEVALSVGFADLSHFEKSFKRVVGQNPREFRRQHALVRAAE